MGFSIPAQTQTSLFEIHRFLVSLSELNTTHNILFNALFFLLQLQMQIVPVATVSLELIP
jgi:hypothetical protein